MALKLHVSALTDRPSVAVTRSMSRNGIIDVEAIYNHIKGLDKGMFVVGTGMPNGSEVRSLQWAINEAYGMKKLSGKDTGKVFGWDAKTQKFNVPSDLPGINSGHAGNTAERILNRLIKDGYVVRAPQLDKDNKVILDDKGKPKDHDNLYIRTEKK